MIAVLNERIVHNHPDWTKGIFIYNCSPEVQRAYWAIALNAVKEINDKNGNTGTVFTQNAFSKVNNAEEGKKISTGRSTYYPHGHVVAFAGEDMEAQADDTPALTQERALYSEISPIISNTISRKLKETDLTQRLNLSPIEGIFEDYPHGYEFMLDDPLTGDLEAFTEFMRLHHKAYSEAMMKIWVDLPKDQWKKYWGENHPFPSYRDYLYYEEGKLKYRVSPVLLCPDGALEPSGIKLLRDQEHTSQFSSHEEFKESLIAGAGRIIRAAISILQ